MTTGVAVLGVLAGSLASFFRLDHGEPDAAPDPGVGPADFAPLVDEIALLRGQVALLTSRLDPPSSGG